MLFLKFFKLCLNSVILQNVFGLGFFIPGGWALFDVNVFLFCLLFGLTLLGAIIPFYFQRIYLYCSYGFRFFRHGFELIDSFFQSMKTWGDSWKDMRRRTMFYDFRKSDFYDPALHLKFFSLMWSILLLLVWGVFFYFLWATGNFSSSLEHQFILKINLGLSKPSFLSFGCDSFGVVFLVLTFLLGPICFLSSWGHVNQRVDLFCSLIFFTQLFLLGTFTACNPIMFYIFFEAVLIPVFLLIGYWGSEGPLRVKAAYYFFFFTLVGSIFILLTFLYVYVKLRSFEIENHFLLFSPLALSYETYSVVFSLSEQCLILLVLFVGFGFKVPIYPIHLWLPAAHVEAPTAGSVLLAGIILKLGGYGFGRFLILFYGASFSIRPVVLVVTIVSLYFSLSALLVQLDLKRAIAYSSIAHMNFSFLGLASGSVDGAVGGSYMFLTHGIGSSALFVFVGLIYDRFKNRNIVYIHTLIDSAPVLSGFFFIYTLANAAFPGTGNFIAELFILSGLIHDMEYSVFLFVGFASVLNALASFWLFSRVVFGRAFSKGMEVRMLTPWNLAPHEFYLLFMLAFYVIYLGFFPGLYLGLLEVYFKSHFGW